MDYRQRCYESYGLQWEQYHSSSPYEFDFYAKIAKKKFRKFLPVKKSAKIVDVACGAGHFLYFLKKEGYTNVRGIDLSKDQLDIARKMGITEVEEKDLFEYLSKCLNEYEMIFANNIIEHLKKDEVFRFLDILYQALKPGGKVFIITDNAHSLFGSAVPYFDFTHEESFTFTSLTQVLRVCGFENIEIYGEGPAIYDFKSLIRCCIWKIIKVILRAYLVIERGTGRGLFKNPQLLEPKMFALAQKPIKTIQNMPIHNFPKVSIMIPVYNQEQYVEQAIESALNQDYPNLEVIVSDDCSSDNSLTLIKKLGKDHRLKYFRNEKNLGMTGNHMKLLCDYASGEWVMMLDGDDYLIDNHFIKTAMDEMRKYENVVMMIGGPRIFYPDKEYDVKPCEVTRLKNGFDVFLEFFRVTPSHGSIIYKRELAIRVGGYEYQSYDDFALILKILLHGNAILLNKINSVWRHHDTNFSDAMPFPIFLKAKEFIDGPHEYALKLNYDKNKLNNWRKRMYSWHFYSYLSNKIRSLKRGLINKKEADRDINVLIKYLFENKNFFLFFDVNVFGRIIVYKLFGASLYEFITDRFKKINHKFTRTI